MAFSFLRETSSCRSWPTPCTTRSLSFVTTSRYAACCTANIAHGFGVDDICINACAQFICLSYYPEASDYQTHAQYLGGEGGTSLLRYFPRSAPPTITLLLGPSAISLANFMVSRINSAPCCADLHSPSDSLTSRPGCLPHLF